MQVKLTAPLGVRIARTAVYNLQDDWVRIAVLAHSVVRAVVFGVDQLEALAARQIIVKLARQRGPELVRSGCVSQVRSQKMTSCLAPVAV